MALVAVASGPGSPSGSADAPDVYPNWESRVYQYELDAAAEAGFTVGSVKASVGSRLLVMDTVRSATRVVGDLREVWGYGYRFLVEVSNVELAGKLTLPAIAGAVESTQLEANIRLEVKGYAGGDLWKVIPPPKPLDVDSYRSYMEAIELVQGAFSDNPENAFPVLLAEGSIDDIEFLIGGIDRPDLKAAVLLTWTLRAIQRGVSRVEAAHSLLSLDHDLDEAAQRLVDKTYDLLVGEDAQAAPNDAAKAEADSLLVALESRS